MPTPESPAVLGAPVRAERRAAVGPFVLDLDRHSLSHDGRPVRIGSRALSVLIALIEADGELVSKEALIARVWPDTFVEEANLRVHVAALRKVLGDTNDPPQYIANVAGRGYRYVGARRAAPEPSPLVAARPDGPTPLTRLIGRQDEVATLRARVTLRRLITVSGPGGIGKTSVAFAVAQQLQESFEDGIVAVDLSAAATDEGGLRQAIAIALKISLAGDSVAGLAAFLKDKHLLLLLDNCEHIIDAVTEISEYLLRQSPRLHILATSTEPMRAEGEWIFRLLPLAVPSEAENMAAKEALSIPAIELFVERAAASSEAFQFNDQDVPLVSEICRRLDGNPLAIEIAAASVEAFGLRDLASHLDDRFQVLVRGRRTAAPRQQTLRNLLDWSHGTLSASEQATLRRLSIFRGAFTLEGARMVATLGGAPLTVVSDVASLVRKSLLSANLAEPQATYRLLDSTRAYARDRAVEAGELTALCRLHADYFEELLRTAELAWTQMGRVEWLAAFGYMIDDARAATDWALSPEGDLGLGLRLTALLLPLGFQFALVGEMGERINDALARADAAEPREWEAEIRLLVSRASLSQSRGTELGEEDPDLKLALLLAGETGNPVDQVGALIKIAVHYLNIGRYADGLHFADQASEALRDTGDDLAGLGVDRVLAQAADMAGDHERARAAATRVLQHPARNIPLHFGSLQIDRNVSMRVVLARSLWLQGLAGQAKSAALEALTLARQDGPYAIGLSLGLGACPIALWSGLDDEAEALTHELRQKSERYTLGMWELWGRLFEMVLARRRGDEPLRTGPTIALQADSLATFDPQLIDAATMERARAGAAGWANPELLRVMALHALKSKQGAAEAWLLLDQSLDQAAKQRALAWQLRTATTMAGLHLAAGRRDRARAVLEPVFEQLREGFNTADALEARDLLQAL